MIDIYKSNNTDYSHNGDMTLMPTSAKVHAVLNDAWEATLTHPIDAEGRWMHIEDGAVVKMPSFNGDQLFRVKKKVKKDSHIEATLDPIFMDSKDDCFLLDIRPTGKTGQQALDLMMAPNKKYKGKSDIMEPSTAYYVTKNLIDAINGDDDNSFVNRWGGEILFDNYNVTINKRVGSDRGLQLLYGRNITKDGINETVDFSGVVTRIVPKAYNGYMIDGDAPWVDSPLINKYPTIKTKVVTFGDVKMRIDAQDGDADNGVIVCDTQAQLKAALTEKCNEQYANGLDKPKVTLSVSLILLQNTEIYKEYAILENVFLGDDVHCNHEKLNISTNARVVELTYDCLLEKVDSVVMGDFKYNYFDNVTSTVNRIDGAIRPDGTVVGEKIQGILNAVNAKMMAQATAASPAPVRAMLFEDLVPGSPSFGAMCLGSMGFQIASERTDDGFDWKWRTFGTGQGFFADLIVAGTMLGDRIKGGTIGIGGTDTGRDGKIEVKDAKDNLIGKWDINGIDILKGLIRGGKIQSTNYIDGNQGTLIDLEKSEIVVYGTASIDGRDDKYKIIINDSGITAVGKMFEMRLNNQGLVVFDSENRNNFMQMIVSGNDNRESVILMKNENKYMRISQNGIIFADAEGSTIKPPGTVIDPKFIDVKELRANGNAGKTGTAQFSDGSYLRFINGILVDGYTSSGGGL